MPDKRESIGIIAGGGKFPLMAAESARKQGLRVIAIAHDGETDPALSDSVDTITWIKLGQLGKLISAFKKNQVKKALMAGTITKRHMFSKARPDLKGLTLISKLAILHDDGILRAVAGEMAKEGIEIISAVQYLPELLAPPGCLTRKRPGKKEEADIQFGWDVAKELGRLDVGQCVVVRDKTVLALEAIEGTDETIKRGGKLAEKNAVIIKISKPNQDLRFDLPSVGVETIQVMSEVKASVLAVEAGKTLLFDKSQMIEFANRVGIAIVSYQK